MLFIKIRKFPFIPSLVRGPIVIDVDVWNTLSTSGEFSKVARLKNQKE